MTEHAPANLLPATVSRGQEGQVFGKAGLSAGRSLMGSAPSCPLDAVPERVWAALPKEELNRVRVWASALAEVRPPIVESLKRLAERMRYSYSTVRTRYYSWLAADKDPWSLVNGFFTREPATALNPEFRDEWHRRFCGAQRSGAAAYRRLMEDFCSGKPIPGLPAGSDRTREPRGWSYQNLMRNVPPEWVVKASRVGPQAAAQMGPLLYMSRQNLWVGSHYLFDDMWHDLMVNVQDTAKTGRPLEFDCIDLFSGCKVAWGFRVRVRNDDTGKMEGLTEQMMRWLVAQVLAECGWDAERGTVLVTERGTAALSKPLQRLIHELTGGRVTVAENGMQGKPAFVGAYHGPGKGNPRFKAAIESLRHLIHNELDHLPGQTGKDIDHRPEELDGRLDDNDELKSIAEVLRVVRPDLVGMLRMPILNHVQFSDLLIDVYGRINRSTRHRLEGWARMVRPAEDGRTMRRMSRWEVWETGRSRLTRLSPEAVSILVWNEKEAVPRQVRSRMIEIWTKEYSVDVLRFNARALEDGETYLCQVSPINPSVLYAYDARGRLAGICPLIAKPCRADVEAMQAEFGRISKERAEDRRALARVGADLIRKRIEDIRHNDAILREAGLTGQNRESVRRMVSQSTEAGREMAEMISREATPEPVVPDETLDVRTTEPVEEPESDLVDARDQ